MRLGTYVDDAYIAWLNELVAKGRAGCETPAEVALMIIIDQAIDQVLHVPGTPVTLLFRPYIRAIWMGDAVPKPWGNFAVLVQSEHDVRFTNDPWWWEGLTYRERPSITPGKDGR